MTGGCGITTVSAGTGTAAGGTGTSTGGTDNSTGGVDNSTVGNSADGNTVSKGGTARVGGCSSDESG